MAAGQLCGTKLGANMRFCSTEGHKFSILNSRIFVANSLEVGSRGFRAPRIGVCSMGNRKRFVSMRLNGSNSDIGFVDDSPRKNAEDNLDKAGELVKADSAEESVNGTVDSGMHVKEEGVISPPKRTAIIHDFCLGIPFGGLIFSGGLLGFLVTRNSASLTTGALLGAAILALSTLSLKVWRTGKSSLPLIVGQAVVAAVLLRKNLHSYSLTKKVLPSGFYIFLSAVMICFYCYVVLSGGNPPSKKLATASPSELN